MSLDYLICTVTGTLHAADCANVNRANAVGPVPEFAGRDPDELRNDPDLRQHYHHLCGQCLSRIALARRALAARRAARSHAHAHVGRT